jgi:hypothetical protein
MENKEKRSTERFLLVKAALERLFLLAFAHATR